MRRALLVGILLGSSLLAAGCSSPDEIPVAARTHVDVARERAQEWHNDAILGAVSGAELQNGKELARDTSDSDGWRAGQGDEVDRRLHQSDANDAEPGDGKAPRWAYFFVSPSSNDRLAVVVSGMGTVVAAVEGRFTSLGGEISHDLEWTVDSDAAFAAAAQANATFRELRDAPDAGAYSVLSPVEGLEPGDPPYWAVAVGHVGKFREEDSVVLLVNAETGEVTTMEAFLAFSLGSMFAESGMTDVYLDAARPTATLTFELKNPHSKALFALGARVDSAPGQVVEATITGPIDAVTLTHEAPIMDDQPDRLNVTRAPVGTYEVKVALAGGLPLDVAAHVRFSWCTPGFRMPVPFADAEACLYANEPQRALFA